MRRWCLAFRDKWNLLDLVLLSLSPVALTAPPLQPWPQLRLSCPSSRVSCFFFQGPLCQLGFQPWPSVHGLLRPKTLIPSIPCSRPCLSARTPGGVLPTPPKGSDPVGRGHGSQGGSEQGGGLSLPRLHSLFSCPMGSVLTAG